MNVVVHFLTALWEVLAEMSPYLLLGFLVAGILSVVLPPSFVERHLGGRGLWPVAKAALLGVPLPLCSCGVIPVSASLRRHGASRGATTAFLISTPQTGADNIMVVYGLLGPVMAIFSPIVALVMGMFGGTVVDATEHNGNGVPEEAPKACDSECCNPQPGRTSPVLRALHYGFVTLPQDIAGSLILGLAIAALLSVLIPQDFFASQGLGHGLPAMLIMMLVGIPMYVCATASVPIAAAFIAAGFSPGAALVFLISGPATNAAAITTIWKVLGRRTALIYLGTIAGGALLAGAALDKVIRVTNTASTLHVNPAAPGVLEIASAIALLAMLVYALWPRHGALAAKEAVQMDSSNQATIMIQGMTCNHCAEAVRRALVGLPGVVGVVVDLTGGKAVVSGAGFDVTALVSAVESAGYTAMPAET